MFLSPSSAKVLLRLRVCSAEVPWGSQAGTLPGRALPPAPRQRPWPSDLSHPNGMSQSIVRKLCPGPVLSLGESFKGATQSHPNTERKCFSEVVLPGKPKTPFLAYFPGPVSLLSHPQGQAPGLATALDAPLVATTVVPETPAQQMGLRAATWTSLTGPDTHQSTGPPSASQHPPLCPQESQGCRQDAASR